MKLAITGALGHIGSKLIRELPAKLFTDVLLLDNLRNQRYASLFNLPDTPRFQFVQADILEADLENLLQTVDIVIHLAAITNAEASVEIATEVERSNTQGTRLVAEAAAAVGAKYFSLTTSVYGVQEDEVDESCTEGQLAPQSPYAESKIEAEKILRSTAGLNYVICRFGTIFGTSPGMRFHTAVNKFCWQAVMGQPLSVWKTALNQQRPYLALGDAISAIVFLIENNLIDGETYNILTCNATVQEVVDCVLKSVPKLSIELVDSPIMNQLSYTVSTKKFIAQGFSYAGNLEQGIGETVSLLRNAG